MMRWLIGGFLLAFASGAEVQAGPPLSGAEFEADVTGYTLQFRAGEDDYGSEQYLPGRKVIWAFAGGDCRRGRWLEPDPGRICFIYDGSPEPQCWMFSREDNGLRARLKGGDPASALREIGRSPEPIACAVSGPGV